MLNTALVTGAAERIHRVAMALDRQGFEAFAWEFPMSGAADRPLPDSLDCYVQLPPIAATPSSEGADLVGAGTLVCRLDAVARLSRLLAPDAAVVLVACEGVWDPVRRRTFHALASALVAKRAGSGVRVVVVETPGADDIATAARRERDHARCVSFADLEPAMAYADWRDLVLNLTSGNKITYLGWRRDDGVRRVAVLRRAVLSPLPGAGDGSRGLARAVLTDALGASVLNDLERSDRRLLDDFHAEVIGFLPPEEFELPIHEVAAWVVRRSLSDEP